MDGSKNSIEMLESQLLHQIPIVHVKGTNFTVGYVMGRNFKNLIHDYLKKVDFLEDLLSAYSTVEGKIVYENSLQLCKDKYPLLVEELEGIAKGSDVPFHKLFLLHIDTIIIPPKQAFSFHESKGSGDNGCSDLMTFDSKRNLLLLGHTEDCHTAMKNNMFIVVAQVFDKDETTLLEHFAALTYAGYLPGATMGFNRHGLYNTNNTLVPSQTFPDRSPVIFMNRAILGAVSLDEAMEIIRDNPVGVADGFNINFIYAPKNSSSEAPIVQSIEVAPSQNEMPESEYDIQNVADGCSYAHCNKYLRLNVSQQVVRTKSSENRLELIQTYTKNTKVYDLETMKKIFSDQTNAEYPLYRHGKGKDGGVTGAVGIFDVYNHKWYIYKDRPTNSSPIAVISLDLDLI